MATYSVFVIGESNISFTGGVTLDGITQGNGSHLVGEFLTFNSTAATEVFVDDVGTETNFADNDAGQTLDGAQTIDGTTYADGTQIEAEYQFVLRNDATGEEFTALAVNVINSSPPFATNEGLAFVGEFPPENVSLRVVSASEGPPNSGPNAIDENTLAPPCFTPGALIETASGPRLVEVLQPGDAILTRDGSYQRLAQVLRSHVTAADLAKAPNLRPIRITQGALGQGLPAQDLLVSPQHRMVVSSAIAERMIGTTEVLVAATRLTALPGIFVDETVAEVTYLHLVFGRHEIIFADGAATESLFTGPEALKSVPPEARAELLAIYPDLNTPNVTPRPALAIPKGRHQHDLVARHAKSRQPLTGGSAGTHP